MQESLQLNGKVCLITGASQGLGRHFASVLANAGATVVATSLKSEMGKLEDLAHSITRQQRGKIIILDIDVRNYDQLDSKVADIIEQTERIDVLVNNAGVSYYTNFFEIGEQDWDVHIDTNLKGAFFLAQAVAKQMAAQKIAGSIINIGSIAGFQSKRYALPFCISKAGMHHLTKIMAYELTDYGIRVNGISPGLFPTELVTDYIASEAGQAFIQQIPLRRPGRYGELDGALLLLASDASSYMTGSIIEVDGGFAIDLFLREDFEGKTNAFFTPKQI